MQDAMSDDDNWGTWNSGIEVAKEHIEEKVEVKEEVKIESKPRVPIKVPEAKNRFAAIPHILGNKDMSEKISVIETDDI